jgi:Zn-dependent peptidase ImmA (M78 family)
LNGRAEEALERLAKQYNVLLPKLKVGLPKRHRRNTFGCYTPKNQTIYVLNSDVLKEPYVILHEFYHHLRTSIDKKHRGTEKHANEFAKEFLSSSYNP